MRWLAALWLVLAGTLAGAQEFSGLARVDDGASTLTDARGGARLELALSQGVPFRVFTLSGPDRLILDFREVDWTGFDEAAFNESARISAVRTGSFRPGWSRLVADLSEPMLPRDVALERTDPGARLSLTLRPARRAAFDAAAGAPHDPRWDLPEPRGIAAPRDGGPLRVLIDPGHGGIDPGAIVEDVQEADLMLRLAREVKEALLRSDAFAQGVEVHLTRETDVFVSLERRVAIAHEIGADLFLSLHADKLAQGVARGATVYTLSETASDAASAALAERHDREDLLAGIDLTGKDDVVAGVLFDIARLDNTPRSQALAAAVAAGIENATGAVNKHPIKQAGFSVLKAADIPSILVEAGFLSTEADLRNLTDPIWRAGFAAGVRDGIAAWAAEDAALAPLRRK